MMTMMAIKISITPPKPSGGDRPARMRHHIYPRFFGDLRCRTKTWRMPLPIERLENFAASVTPQMIREFLQEDAIVRIPAVPCAKAFLYIAFGQYPHAREMT